MEKVLVIGLDGATFKLIQPWCMQGELPNFTRLMNEGVSGDLESTIHPYSAPAWASFITGKNPGKHGIFDFTYRKPGSYDLCFVNSYTRKGKSLWKLLSEAGKEIGAINIPCTYPPEEVNGFLIPGLGAPGITSEFAYPPSIVEELKQKFSDYVIEPHIRDFIRRNKFHSYLSRLMEVLENRFKAASHFLITKEWDFFMVVFTETDRIQHFYWKYMDPNHPLFEKTGAKLYGKAILNMYKRLDEMVGWFLKEVGEDVTTLIISDHGQGGNSDRALYMNKWLANQGFLRFIDDGSTSHILRRAILIGKKYVSRDIKNRFRVGFLANIRAKGESLVRQSRIDWEKTKAYSDENRGNIWINLKGREPKGTVEEGHEYEDVRKEIIERLRNLVDPETGESIADRIYTREDVYHGNRTPMAPDILFLQKEDAYHCVYRRSNTSEGSDFIKILKPKKLVNDLKPNASHRLMGILMAKGKAFKEGAISENCGIIDLAPTILYLMGVSVPKDMDGKVLTHIMKESYLNEHTISYGGTSGEDTHNDSVYSREEEERVEEQLKDLGYL